MEKSNRVMPAAALVTGIISVLSFLFYYISIPTAILAIVFGAKSRKEYGSGLGLAGMILGIVGLSICILTYAYLVTAIIYSNI